MISAHCHENEDTSVTFRVPFCSLSYHFSWVKLLHRVCICISFFLNVLSLCLLGFRGSRCASLFPPAYLMKTSRGNRSLTTLFVRQRWVNICVQFFSSFDSVCRITVKHQTLCPSFFLPLRTPLILSPHAHHYWTLSLRPGFSAWSEQQLFNPIVLTVPIMFFLHYSLASDFLKRC